MYNKTKKERGRKWLKIWQLKALRLYTHTHTHTHTDVLRRNLIKSKINIEAYVLYSFFSASKES